MQKKSSVFGSIILKCSGLALIEAILLISVFSLLLLVVVTLMLLGLNISQQGARQVSALDIAEAGINYYLWHLVHDPSDYRDGNNQPQVPPFGPYNHDFADNFGNKVGTFTLWITPPGAGSSVVTVESKGLTVGGNENRTVVAKLGIPSFAQYAVVANDTVNHIRFGEGTEIFGPIHNNGGIRFDGIAHSIVTSSLETYDEPDPPYHNAPGVHTHKPRPSEVFLGGTNFPVPTVDFNKITTDLSNLKDLAQNTGIYYGPSGGLGYHIVLKPNDTFDIYKVTRITSSCWSGFRTGWQSTDGIVRQSLVGSGVLYPSNGIIFVEDKLWIDGRIDGAWLTIAAARFPDTASTNKSIIINSDLEYTNNDGSDKIGLIAQDDISVGLYSEGSFSGSEDGQELRIDAALIAQKGRVGRKYYRRQCSRTYYQRNKITVTGSIATNRRYGFTWLCGSSWRVGDACDSGYQIRDIVHDTNLTLNPPPSFPTIGNYAILDWREK